MGKRADGHLIILRYFPYLGMVTILLNDYPQLKKLVVACLGFLVIFNRE